MAKIGDRVGAVSEANDKVVKMFGYGVYSGMEPVPDEFEMLAGVPNPKITLDDGDVVWGFQCWWGPEERVKSMIEGREVVMVTKAQQGREG